MSAATGHSWDSLNMRVVSNAVVSNVSRETLNKPVKHFIL
jgi:hypothetical protein